MFGGIGKNFWGLRVCFLKSKKYTSEKSKKMSQVHLFTTTANNFPSLRCFCARKLVAFVVQCLLVLVLLVGFGLICVFACLKFFPKEKINRFEVVLITSNTILLMCSYLLSIYRFIALEKLSLVKEIMVELIKSVNAFYDSV